MSQKTDDPIAQIAFYPRYISARVREIKFSYHMAVLAAVLVLLVSLALLSGQGLDQIALAMQKVAAIVRQF